MLKANKDCNLQQFEIGDFVWLKSKNLSCTRPCSKLDHKKLGPFEIIDKYSPVSYRLKIPRELNIYPVFHISLLQRFIARPNEPVPTLNQDLRYDNEYYVDKIIDSKFVDNHVVYLIRWKHFGPEEDTWEPLENLGNCLPKVRDFHKKYPRKPKPDDKLLFKRGMMLRS